MGRRGRAPVEDARQQGIPALPLLGPFSTNLLGCPPTQSPDICRLHPRRGQSSRLGNQGASVLPIANLAPPPPSPNPLGWGAHGASWRFQEAPFSAGPALLALCHLFGRHPALSPLQLTSSHHRACQ